MERQEYIPSKSSEKRSSPLHLVIQKSTSVDIEDKLLKLKLLTEDYQLKSIRQLGLDSTSADVLTHYNEQKSAFSTKKSVNSLNRSQKFPIVIREESEEAKLRLSYEASNTEF